MSLHIPQRTLQSLQRFPDSTKDFSRLSDRELDEELSRRLSIEQRSCVDERERRTRAEYDKFLKEIGFLRGSLAAFRKTAHPDIKLRPGKDNGPCIPAHTAILASSSKIFEQMLQCEATPEHTITIPELNSEELESFLEFLYSGSLISDKMEKHVRSLFRAAHKYEILYLQQCCERCILDSLSASNVLDAWELYDFFSSPAIKELALRLVVENMNDITRSNKYKDFAVNYPHVAVQITQAYVDHAEQKVRTRNSAPPFGTGSIVLDLSSLRNKR